MFWTFKKSFDVDVEKLGDFFLNLVTTPRLGGGGQVGAWYGT